MNELIQRGIIPQEQIYHVQEAIESLEKSINSRRNYIKCK